MNIMANLFMAENENAFACADKLLAEMPLGKAVDAFVLDFHGEATSEKCAMGFHLDGRASLVVGTHTHIPPPIPVSPKWHRLSERCRYVRGL